MQKSSERLVFFTDAVVAIALTLLVLPLTDLVPELVAEHGKAVEALTRNGSEIFSFLLSFVVIARLWFTHHWVFEHIRGYSRPLILANFAWLLTIAALPFPTELVGAYGSDRFTVIFYLATILLSNLCTTAMTVIVYRDPEVRGDAEPVTRHSVEIAALNCAALAVALVVGAIQPGWGYYALLLLMLPDPIARAIDRRRGRQPAPQR